MEDRHGRKISYLRISITDLCNLRCKYCRPENGIRKINHEDILRIEEIEQIAKHFVALGVDKIRITGGEPLVRKGILALTEKLGNLENLKDFAMTTNGILLKDYAKQLKNAGLSRVNISIDTLDARKYFSITRGGNIRNVLEGIEEAKKAGLYPIKLNVVLIGGFNDNEVEDFVNLTRNEEMDVRFIELMPVGEVCSWSEDKFISFTEVLNKVKELEPVPNEDISSPAAYYRLPNAKGRIGFISARSCKFCQYCNRVRLTADGRLKPCLHSNEEINIKEPLRKGEDIEKMIRNAIFQKPQAHKLEYRQYAYRNMVEIGG